MKYSKSDAKTYARQHFRGVWAATMTPFDAQFRVDEDGYRQNLDHWINTLKLGGLFVSGKQGEFFSMSVAERKRSFELAVQAADGSEAYTRQGSLKLDENGVLQTHTGLNVMGDGGQLSIPPGRNVALARDGKLAEAVRHFEMALAIDPGHAEAKDYLGRATQLLRQRQSGH